MSEDITHASVARSSKRASIMGGREKEEGLYLYLADIDNQFHTDLNKNAGI